MYENNEAVQEVPREMLEDRIKEQESRIANLERSRDFYQDLYRKASEFVQKSIDSDDWNDSELQEPFWTELADLLDLTLNLETEVTVTATWVLTVKAPRGYEFDYGDFNVGIDADSSSIEIESGEYDGEIDVTVN